MFCSRCGHSMADSARFCPKCGQPVVQVEQDPPPPQASGPAPQPNSPPRSGPTPPGPARNTGPDQGTSSQGAPAQPTPGGTRTLLEGGPSGPLAAGPATGQAACPPPTGQGGYGPPPGPPAPPVASGPQRPARPGPRSKKKNLLPLVLALVAVAAVVAGVLIYRAVSGANAYQQALEAGDGYLASGDYSQAILSYQQALEQRPGDPAATLALSKAYLCDGQFDQAGAALDGLSLAEGDEHYDRLQQLRALWGMDPTVAQVDTSAFPVVTIQLSYSGGFDLTADQITVTEGGQTRSVQQVQPQEGGALISYVSQDTDVSDEARSFDLSLVVDDVPFRRGGDYTTPHFDPATVQLVSTDVSQYPVVRAYFRVEDSASGDNVAGLTNTSFTILERVAGGEYLAREVQAVSPLEGNAGLNIALVADKSDSIYPSDMEKIKRVMTEFVHSLHYDVGDKAEVLAFDTVVQQMCYYTDDPTLLVNGINNMSTDGRTAFYDAVYDGITHAALQGGARCVIAFTDGMDNESRYTPNEVISYALAKQVPVYIIGVGGSVEESTLERIALNTGGQYWFIDDLYDLEEIFGQVYTQQKELYLVEYVSDSALDAYAARDLTVQVSGGGHRGSDNMSFTPVPSINDGGGTGHTNRYQLIQECLSWEDASRKCQEMGGHLATITSQAEMDEIVQLAEAAGVRYLWLGGTTSYDDDGNVFGHWVTGEPFTFQAWAPGEPSRVDQDGTEEWYIMLWNVQSLGGWTWNDQRNDPAAAVPSMKEAMAYVCEFET